MKHILIGAALLLSFLGICSPVCAQKMVMEGDWLLDSIQVNKDGKVTKFSGTLPQQLYYTCPLKIKIVKDSPDCFFYFNNEETKNVSYYIHESYNVIHFSFLGQGSAPERQYSYQLEATEDPKVLILRNNNEMNADAFHGAEYIYHYSIHE